MTKEEAIKVIRHMAYLSAHVIENGVEAYEYIEQLLSKPSLPSNLDEAAEEYANTHYGEFVEVEYEFGSPIETIVDDKPFVRDAFKVGAQWRDAQILKLPNNIDEAMEEESQHAYSEPTAQGFAKRLFFKRGFKAGAEWMAGQGETHEHYVIREVADHDIGPAIISYPETFEIGDKVVVQIRKK